MGSHNYTERAGLAKQMLPWGYILAMPCSMLRIWTYVYSRMLHVLVHGGVCHARTGNWKACLSFFVFEGNDRYNEQIKYKRDDNFSEKKTDTLSYFFIRILRNNFSGRISVCRYVRFKHTS